MSSIFCPYCSAEIQTDDNVIICPSCQAAHHSECWSEFNYHCSVFGCPGSGHISSRQYNPQASQTTTISSQTILGHKKLSLLGIAKAILIGIFIVIIGALVIWASSQIDLQSVSTVSTNERKYTMTSTIKYETKKNATESTISTETKKNSTSTIPNQPENYYCIDIDKVELFVGANGVCGDIPVNVRENPQVPDDTYENVISYLKPGENFIVIDGPRCAHAGTWWKIKLQSGLVGWAREYSSSYGRLIFWIDN